MNRRKFITITTLATLGLTLFQSCKNGLLKLIFKVTGANHILGHRLWTKDFPPASERETYDIVVIGGGISGLTAMRELEKQGYKNIALFEMEDHLGGNSSSRSNNYSAYPTGAHYVPAINLNFPELTDFFLEENIITSIENGKAIYNPEYVCHDNKERLFINYQWIAGVEPQLNNSAAYHQQFEWFVHLMQAFRLLQDENGKFVFDLPIAYSSIESTYTDLDKISMLDWLTKQGLTEPHLLWYINYCCLDDYGRSTEHVSAWAGIHYFASRKHHLYSNHSELLTWPEGNAFLVERLKQKIKSKQLTQHLAFDIKEKENSIEIALFNQKKQITTHITANKVILATPHYINKYLLKTDKKINERFQYSPWILATITIERFPISEGVELSWENIIYEGKGLGYIYNQHQLLSQTSSPFVITYYRALDSKNLQQSRKDLLSKSDDYWKEEILSDLKKAHPEIEDYILEMEIYKRGHGMISPEIDFIHSEALAKAKTPINGKIYFAHTDYSGISLFEEGFYQGINAVKQLVENEK